MIKTTLHIDPAKTLSYIAPEIYGQFSEHLGRCIYDGVYVGEDSEIPNKNGMRNDVVDALRALKLPVLRWPGGCFADEYHWRDGIGPKEKRRRMVNTNWGGTVEDNSFGTHEFMELCDQLGCEPYVAVNLGSGTVQEAAEWIEYMTADGDSTIVKQRQANGRKEPWHLKYVGIGNENWGCGGSMSPDFYANEYKRYQCFCKNYGDNKLYKVACGPSAEDYNWTKELMSRIDHGHANAISLHYYTLPGDWEHKGSATNFDEQEYYTTISKAMYIENIIEKHLEIMDEHDPEHNIDLFVDEWGTWYDVEPGTNPGFLYQQNTMRDAIVAALSLNIFNKHSDRIAMANIAQVVNVLQAMLLTEGSKILKTPTYDVFRMYVPHQGAELVESHTDETTCVESGRTVKGPAVHYNDITIPALSESVSVTEQNGQKMLTITLANTSLCDTLSVELELPMQYSFAGEASIAMLDGEVHAYNTFEDPDHVRAHETEEEWSGNIQTLTLPVNSVCRVNCYVC